MAEAAIATVTARLLAAPKYRDVHPETIVDVVRRESTHGGDVARLEQLARSRLHKVAALHLFTARVGALRRELDRVDVDDPERLRSWCREVLARHFSTAERLADLDQFYPTMLSLVPPPRTIVDVACALNPFTIPWLRDVCDAGYVGYDFNTTFVDLGNAFFARSHSDCAVVHQDVITGAVPATVDLAILLKTFHCIEDRHHGAALSLVDRLAANHVVVSFPTKAMNGRAAVFTRRNIDDLIGLAERRGWRWSRAALTTEEFLAIAKV